MLSITSKTYYGVTAILELAENFGNGVLQIKDISTKKNIPKNYLEQLLNRLLKSGLIKSTRGKKGGYALADKPEHIKLLDVIEILEGKIKLTGSWENNQAIYQQLKKAEDEFKNALDISLQDILEEQKKLNGSFIFHI